MDERITRKEFSDLREDLREDFKEVRSEMHLCRAELRKEMTAQDQKVENAVSYNSSLAITLAKLTVVQEQQTVILTKMEKDLASNTNFRYKVYGMSAAITLILSYIVKVFS